MRRILAFYQLMVKDGELISDWEELNEKAGLLAALLRIA